MLMWFLIQILLLILEQPATPYGLRLGGEDWPLKHHCWHGDGKFFSFNVMKVSLAYNTHYINVLYLFFVINCATIVSNIFMSPKYK